MNVILIAAISANGMIGERTEQSSMEWTSKEDAKFFAEKTKEIGVVVMGRKTFETIGRALKGRRTIVLSRSRQRIPVHGVEWTDESPKDLLFRLQKEGVETVALAGGSSIYGLFLQEHLVDELFLTVQPVLFDEGIPLAVGGFGRLELELIEASLLGKEATLLHYRIKKQA